MTVTPVSAIVASAPTYKYNHAADLKTFGGFVTSFYSFTVTGQHFNSLCELKKLFFEAVSV